MLRTSVVLPSLCLTGHDGEQELHEMQVLPARLEAIRSHGQDLPAAGDAAAQRRER
jgi:hypothetical protein